MSIAKQRASRTTLNGVYLSKLPEYSNWANMSYRCSYPKNPRYEHYGGRGIKVCARWRGKDGFANFLEDMGRKPTPNHSIERLDNNKNYKPSNCRWGTPHEQALNKRMSKRNTTGYIGVVWHPGSQKYRVRINKLHIGMYKDIEEAAIAYDMAVMQYYDASATTNYL